MDLAVIFDAFCRLLFIIDELCLHKFSNVVFCITNFFHQGTNSQRHTNWHIAGHFFYLDDLIYVTLPESI